MDDAFMDAFRFGLGSDKLCILLLHGGVPPLHVKV